jgi:DNA-binding response OmpR family regulator
MILSAKADETHRVMAFRLGADDFMAKPFSLLELLERTKRHLLRRGEAANSADIVRIGGVLVNITSRVVVRDDRTVQLRPKEADLLCALINASGSVLSKQMLLERVWGHRTAIRTNTVEYHIATVRQKIESNPRRPRHILTVSKAGYRIEL